MLWGFSRWRLSDFFGGRRRKVLFARGLVCLRPVAEELLSLVCQFPETRFCGQRAMSLL